MKIRDFKFQIPLMVLAVGIVLAATWAGLIRLGWGLPFLQSKLPVSHGPLMVAGFFSTLISLERAVALGKLWTFVGPLLSGLGGLLLGFGVLGLVGPLMMTLGSTWLVITFVVILKKHRSGYILVMALGALALLVGNLLWLFGQPIYEIVLWWAGFLILTIAGERLELGRMIQLSNLSQIFFSVVVIIFLSGLVILLPAWKVGVRLSGVGILFLGLWLLRYDIARRTVKGKGLTRFIAVCLLSGYFWLLIAGAISLIYGATPAGPIYDALLHAIFLGFVFAMVFGHTPIIFPALLEVDIEYKLSLYLPLIILNATLVIRIGGEMAGFGWARLWGGLFNVISVIFYVWIISPIPRLINYKTKDKG